MGNKSIQKFFADQNSVIDLSSLGNAKGAKVSLSGPDMNITTPRGSVIIVNGALYSSIKGNNLAVKFKDKTITGAKILGSVDLKDIQLERIDSSLVDSAQVEKKGNGKRRNKKEEEELKKQLDDAENAKKEADKAKEEAEKAKEAAEKALNEAFEVQNSSKQIEEMLQNFLADNVAKDNLAQQSDASQQNTQAKATQASKQNDAEKVLPQPINKNTSTGKSNSSKNEENKLDAESVKEPLKVTLALAAESNSGSKDDSITNFTKPQFVGSTAPNATVIIKINGIAVGQAVADSLGNFTFTAPETLTDGTYNLEAEAKTADGSGSAKLVITIDSVTDKPTFELSPESSVSGHKGLTPTLTPSIVGTAEENAKVDIYVDNKLVASVDVDKDGNWSYEFKDNELSEGENSIKVVAVDKAGNKNETTDSIITDTISPEKPTIELDDSSDSGIKNDNITNSTLPTFIGVAEPGSTVSIYLGLKHLGEVIVAKDGTWSYTLTTPLKDGEYNITATATDIAGHTSATANLPFTIDTRISYFSAEIETTNDSGIVGDNVTNNTRPTFTGKTEPNAIISVINSETGEEVIFKANDKGEWTFNFTSDSVEGINNLTFTVEDVAGNKKDFSFSYVIDTIAPVPPTVSLEDYVVLPNGIILSGNDLPALVGTAEPKSTILLMRDGKLYDSIEVDSNGTWNYQFSNKFLQGAYDIEIISQDAAGNKSSTVKYSFTIQTEVVPPKAELDASDDSGAKGDWITNKHNALTLLGTADRFATVNILIDGKTIGVTTADADGNWNFDISRNLSDNVYKITVESIDPLGRTSSVDYQLTIDSFTPIPTVMLHDSADSGVKGDMITKINTPLFTGMAEANAKVSIYVDGVLSGEAIAGDDGVWNFQFTTALSDGSHDVTVKVEDIAGNTASSSAYNFQIVTQTQKPTIELVNDTGVDNTDHIINEKNPALTGTAAPYSTVKLYIDGALIAEVRTNKDGRWEYTLKADQGLVDGDHRITASVEDIAGNIAHSDPFLISVDTAISIPIVSLSPDSDSGIADDNLTNIVKPTLHLKDIDPDIISVQVWDAASDTQIGVATQQPDGSWAYTFTSDLTEGLHQVYVKVEDIAGNKANSAVFDFTIDTTVSTPVISLLSKDDTGVTGDNLTNINKPGFAISGVDADAHRVVVQVMHNGVSEEIELSHLNGSWLFIPGNTWADGSYTLTVKVEDKAGNTNYSAPLTVVIDTQIAIDGVELVNDSGVKGDNMTNDDRPHFRVTVPTDVNEVRLSIDGGNSWVQATPGVAGSWEYIWPTDLADGQYTLTVEATDKAGNTVTKTIDFAVDTTLSTPVIVLDSADDTGIQGDNMTNRTQPTFNLQHIDDDAVRVTVSVEHGGVTTTFDATKDAGGWTFTPPTSWGAGEYTLSVSVEDKAGNTSHSASLTVTVDTQIAINNIELVNDSGIPDDNLTNNVRPHFQVTVPTDVNEVRLSIDGGKTWFNATQSATPGAWDYIWPDDVADGGYTLTVEATDKAGNKTTQELDFTIDTTLSVPTLSLDSADDSGIAGDNITNVKTPGFTLNNIDTDVSRVIVEVMHNGIKQEVPLVQTGGQWRFAPTSDWADGDYILTVKVEDRAGNVKQSAPLTVTVDTHIAIDRIELVNDSGIPDDNLTNEVRPHFQVTVPADVNGVRLSIDGGKTWFDATQSATSGVWDYTWLTNVANGPHTLMVEASDKAGNKTTQKLDFTIDTILSEPTITLDSADDSAAGDNITNVKMPGFTLGNIDADVTKVVVTVAHDGKNQQIELIKNGGVWRFTPGAAWTDGDYTLTVKVEDKAGNTNYSAPLTVTIDTQTSIDRIELLNDTGIVGDNLTNEARPQFHITVPTDVNSVQLSLDGGINWVNATLTSDGVWEYIWPTDLVENTYTLTVKATDVAGNTATETLNFIIDTTLSTPTITLDSADDSGTANDNKTNVKTPGFIIGGIDSDVTQVVVQVMRDGHSEEVELTQTNGQWRFVPGSAWTDGDYTLTVTVKDEAGNIRHSAPLTVTIDTQITIDHIELVNDSGIPDDNLTNNVRPHFQVTVPTDVNVVRLSIDGGKTWFNATQSATPGVWDYTWLADVGEGKHTLTVEATDKAGNKTTQQLDFIIDTLLSEPTIVLDSTDDSGTKGDNLTNVNKPTFLLGNIDADARYVTVEVQHGGTKEVLTATKDATGNWSVTPTGTWADGDYTLTVRVEDEAGNEKHSASLTVTVDTQITIDVIELVNDNGIPGDNMTNDAHPQFRVTVPGDVNEVSLSIDGGVTWVKATQSATPGVWNYTWPGTVPDGDYTLNVKATDNAGNTVTETLHFTIDTTLSTPVIVLDSADDTGIQGDNMTNRTQPTFNLQHIDDDAVRVTVSVEHGGVTTTFDATKDAGGWTFTPPTSWGAGEYTLSVSVEDKAGNTSHSASLTVTVDTQIAINNIELVNDSGIPDDNLTNNVRPHFQVTVPTDVNEVRLSIDGGKTWFNATQSVTPGVWDYTWLADVGEGKHTLTVEATDKAGNQTTQKLDFIIDTMLSEPTIVLDSTDDSGTKGDNLTNANKPTFILGNIDADARYVTVEVQHGGTKEVLTATKGATGIWSVTPTGTWADGDYTLTVRVEDDAGNVKYSAPLTVTVDTQITIDVIELVNDNGIPGDNLTNDVRPHFRVTVPGDVNEVRLSIDGGNTWVRATQGTAGTWDYTWPKDVTDGLHTLTVEATDKAGNKTTQTLDFTIDTRLSTPTIAMDSRDDTGAIGDHITSVKRPGFTIGNIDSDAQSVILRITQGGNSQEVTLTQVGGQWRFTPDADWADGSYTLTVEVTDNAGNVRQSTPLIVTVDTQTSITDITLVNDHGVPDDNLTNSTRPQFEITVPADVNSVQLSIDGGANWVSAAQGIEGVWGYTWPTDMGDGKHTLTVMVTDRAGNTATQTLEFFIDTRLSTPTIALDSTDDTGTPGDDMTNRTRPTFILQNIDSDVINVTVSVTHNGTTTSFTATQGAGGWSFTPPAPWGDGDYTLTVTVDTQIAIDRIELVNDSGVPGDNVTKHVRPQFQISVPDDVEKVLLSIDGGTTWVTAIKSSTAGIWDYTWPTDMPEGQHTLTVEVTDGAGNKMTETLNFTIDITLLTPTIELAPDQDTGQNKNDNLTSVTQPVFVLGSIDKDVRHVELSIEHNGTFKTVVLTESADGWRYRPDSALADGSYTFTVTVTDVAGNQQTSAPLKVTIDGTLTTPVIELAAGEDSGTVGDRLTNHDRPVFDIHQVDSDVTRVMVKVTYNGKTHEEAAVFTNGQWRFTPSASWADGSYQLAVVVEDLAGNVKESAPFEVRIDTTTTINNIVLLNDTGVQNDQLTNVAKPSFRIDVPGDVVQVRVTLDGGANWNVIRKNADGQWIFDSPNTLVDGTYTLRVEATDEAGNIANKDLVFNIDTNIQVPTIALDAGQDTGANTADNITNISRPTFTIGNVDPDVIKVVVTIDGHDYNATKVGAGWQFTPGNAIPDGSYNITVTVEDKAGNTATSKPLPVVIDTTAEIESVTLVTDSGDSDVDNITKVDKPQFSIVTADDITHVRVKIDNAANWIELTKGGDGRWIFNVGSALPDGQHTLLVDVTDIAGNVAQETLQFTIDTTLREPTIVLDPTHDTGDDTNDNLTRINKPVFIIGNVDNDVSHIVVHIDGRDYTIENTGGNLTFTPDQPLSDGQHTISVTVTDIAGNTKTSAELRIEIDTQVQIDSVTLTTDSGVNDHDNVTNATRPSFEIATPDDVTSVLVSFDGVNWTPISKNAAGQWEFTAGSALPDGHYTLHVQATDRAGNTANSTLGFTVDTQIDGLSVVMLDDAGKDSTDGITNITSPRFEISAREPLQSVTVILNGKSSTLTQGAGNKWLFTPDTPLVDGTYKIEIVAEDIAGNKISKEVSFTIDTIFSDPSIDLLDADDTGESAVDNITSVTTPRFVIGNVPADIDTVVIRINGVSYPVTANGNNLWEFQVPVALNDGVYEAVVVFRDIAGNTSETKLPFTIDTTTSVSVRMEPASDTGNSNSDNLTNKQNPKFEGTAEPNAKLVITIVDDKSGREVLKQTITVGADGNWSVTPNILPDGMYTINVVATDVAGNTAQTQERFTIDTVTIDPTIRLSDPSIDDQHEATSLRPEFKGFAEAFSTIMIQWDGKVVGSANANANGEWSWTPPSVLAPGSYVVSIVAKDKAGNESSQVDFPVVIPVIDVTPPTIKLSEESDSGALGDFTTNNKTPTLIGSTLPNTIVSIYVDGVKVGEATADTAGRYTFQLSEMKDGHYVVQVGIVNPRDNSELRSTAVDVTIDTEVAELVWNISGMHEGGYINTVTPEIGGTSEPNSKITIFVNGVEKAIAYTTGAGHWGVVLPALGNDGNYELTFKVEDVAGNIREFGPQNVILDTVISPLTVVLREADDSGKVGDWITNKSHVTIDGTAEAGSTLTIRNPQGVVIATLVVGNDGRWSAELDLREGSNAFVVVSEDKAGNSQQKEILIEHDTQIEISDISLSRDTNSGDKYDLITNNKSPVLVAMTDPGATVQVYINGVLQGTVEASSSGNISYTMPANSADGEYQVQFVATDTAGNRVESAITTVTIDSQIAVFDIDEDSLPALSNNRALSVSGVGEAGSQVSIFVDGKLVNVVMVEADGTWRAPILLQDDGTFNIHFSITDVAGNTEVSKNYSVDVDSSTDFPTLNLEDASNSGSLDDLITNHNKPVLVGTAEAGATIHIYVDEKIVANVLVLEDGTWSYQFDNALKDGEYSIRVVAEDPAGNTAESPRLLVTIDTSTFIDNPAMVAGSDNGIFSNDSITSQTRPTFSIFGEMNQSVQIFIDGVLVDTIMVTDRNQVYRPESPLGDGSHSIYYVITDKAGNTATSKTLNFTIDTLNTTPVAIDSIGGQTLAEMTGSDGKIYITDTTRNLLFSGSAEPNSKIEIIINGLNVGEVWVNDKGHWQMPVNPLYFTEGQLDITVKSTDRAGNVNQEKYSIWVDTHIQVFTSELDDNKSSSKTDWWSNSSTITMRGMGEIGATVSLIVAGVTLATAVVAANGQWELSTDQLPEGKYDITLSIEDNAGNRKEEVHEIFIDRTPPNAPVVTYSDIVNDLIIMQGTAEAKSQLIITDSNGNTYTLTVPDNGKWSMAIPYPSEGKFTITSVDAIGNRSDDVPLDIMKEVPVISLSPDSDSGTVGDNITRDKQPTFIIGNLESDVVVVQVDINGTVYNAEKNADGVWFFTPGTPLTDGSYTISVIASDAAGNQKNSLPITVTIDSTLTVPEIALAAGEDNGASDSDNVTNHTQPKFTLQHIDADVTGVTVNVTHNGVTDIYQATQGADGWTFTPPAAWNDGNYTLSVTVVDRAGNSQQSASLAVTVDSTVTVTADSQHDDASDDATATAVTPPESETVNAESATHLRTVPSAAEESVVKETAYSITLLNADSGDEIDRSISQTPSFEISVPENIVNVSVMFEGEEFTLPITNQKAIFEVPLSLEDGEYTMDVKFIDKDNDFLIKEKTFSVDHSSADIVNAMNARGKTEDDINDSPSTSSVGHNNNGAIDVFAVNEVTLPVDNQEEHA
ncbi:non-fimbrial adhesin SiiE [Salmonella enterica subsp. enterica serovar Abortusovis]|uniref:non-fimbrial adhesin SiiE n=1 Tax=Salmonella enterica TaxID=28901 RepID=UPI002ACD36F1|nr:non-fimbrial adhesin SiiE [Salmonella enterica]WQG07845.1 non-fimbrial adhesin SiiE [Salmonella enterica subsp. enterica serovar Abortusovis]